MSEILPSSTHLLFLFFGRSRLTMARSQSPTEWLRTSRSGPEQIASLQLLKNEITGHVQKKEKYVEKGVLDQIVRLLQTSRSVQDHNGKERRDSISQPRSLSEQEEIRLQALQLLSVIANGRSTMPPLVA